MCVARVESDTYGAPLFVPGKQSSQTTACRPARLRLRAHEISAATARIRTR